MKFSLILSIISLAFIALVGSTPVSALEATDIYRNSLMTECDYSSASVGVGNVRDGVVVTIDSFDDEITRCIKNSSWIGYFSNFGNSVRVEISNTTLGVQIVATSTKSSVSTDLKNVQWASLINNQSSNYITSKYTNRLTRTNARYIPKRKIQYTTYPGYELIPTQTPTRRYIAGSSIWNTRDMYRSLSYESNGVKMTFSSADYNTMRTLQSYYFTGLFSDFSGVSITVVNISGGVEVKVTSGSSSTVEQIQKIGYALVYN